MTKMFSTTRHTGLLHTVLLRSVCAAALAAGIAVSQSAAKDAPQAPEITAFAAAAEPPVFDTPEAAV
ncbi:MAG: hypothetical protein E5Y59_08345, partial [Mesorhizobium sp.]